MNDASCADAGFQRLLGRRLGSPDAYRRFLYAFHDDRLVLEAQRARAPEQKAYIVAENAPLRGLHQVNVDLVGRIATLRPCTTATLDHDATIQESHKQEAQPHYQGGRGYQPSVIYWAEQDLALADEYRDGNVPAGMNNLPLIQRGFAMLPETVQERNFRADSACYHEKVLKWLADEQRPMGRPGKIGLTVSADMTEPLRQVCAAVPEQDWTLVEERADETVACADVVYTPGDWKKDAQPLRYVAVRIQKKQGELFASGFDTMYRGGGEQPVGDERTGVAALALAEGRDDRARARRDEERVGRRGAALRSAGRERGVVPAEPDHVQPAERGQVAGVAAVAADGAAQAPCGGRCSRSLVGS